MAVVCSALERHRTNSRSRKDKTRYLQCLDSVQTSCLIDCFLVLDARALHFWVAVPVDIFSRCAVFFVPLAIVLLFHYCASVPVCTRMASW
jgi:hypothetical protein